ECGKYSRDRPPARVSRGYQPVVDGALFDRLFQLDPGFGRSLRCRFALGQVRKYRFSGNKLVGCKIREWRIASLFDQERETIFHWYQRRAWRGLRGKESVEGSRDVLGKGKGVVRSRGCCLSVQDALQCNRLRRPPRGGRVRPGS